LWQTQLCNNNTTHFPTLHEHVSGNANIEFDVSKYATELTSLQNEFEKRFQEFRRHESSFRLFSLPFDVDVGSAPEKFQMELIEMQCNSALKSKFGDVSIIQFYQIKI
jgi:hypothetical protein